MSGMTTKASGQGGLMLIRCWLRYVRTYHTLLESFVHMRRGKNSCGLGSELLILTAFLKKVDGLR
jgi:hypothetical protein